MSATMDYNSINIVAATPSSLSSSTRSTLRTMAASRCLTVSRIPVPTFSSSKRKHTLLVLCSGNEIIKNTPSTHYRSSSGATLVGSIISDTANGGVETLKDCNDDLPKENDRLKSIITGVTRAVEEVNVDLVNMQETLQTQVEANTDLANENRTETTKLSTLVQVLQWEKWHQEMQKSAAINIAKVLQDCLKYQDRQLATKDAEIAQLKANAVTARIEAERKLDSQQFASRQLQLDLDVSKRETHTLSVQIGQLQQKARMTREETKQTQDAQTTRNIKLCRDREDQFREIQQLKREKQELHSKTTEYYNHAVDATDKLNKLEEAISLARAANQDLEARNATLAVTLKEVEGNLSMQADHLMSSRVCRDYMQEKKAALEVELERERIKCDALEAKQLGMKLENDQQEALLVAAWNKQLDMQEKFDVEKKELNDTLWGAFNHAKNLEDQVAEEKTTLERKLRSALKYAELLSDSISSESHLSELDELQHIDQEISPPTTLICSSPPPNAAAAAPVISEYMEDKDEDNRSWVTTLEGSSQIISPSPISSTRKAERDMTLVDNYLKSNDSGISNPNETAAFLEMIQETSVVNSESRMRHIGSWIMNFGNAAAPPPTPILADSIHGHGRSVVDSKNGGFAE